MTIAASLLVALDARLEVKPVLGLVCAASLLNQLAGPGLAPALSGDGLAPAPPQHDLAAYLVSLSLALLVEAHSDGVVFWRPARASWKREHTAWAKCCGRVYRAADWLCFMTVVCMLARAGGWHNGA